jgi:hypothetical protein
VKVLNPHQHGLEPASKSKLKLCYNRGFSRLVRLASWFLLLSNGYRLVDVQRSLWREDGPVVCHTQSAVISRLSVCTIYILQVIKCMYIQHIQGLCQFRLSTADNVLPLEAPATTAVYSLERSYAWPPPNLSVSYFLCYDSPCPILRTFAFLWFCRTSACCLHKIYYVIIYVYTMLGVSIVTTAWRALRLRMEETSSSF